MSSTSTIRSLVFLLLLILLAPIQSHAWHFEYEVEGPTYNHLDTFAANCMSAGQSDSRPWTFGTVLSSSSDGPQHWSEAVSNAPPTATGISLVASIETHATPFCEEGLSIAMSTVDFHFRATLRRDEGDGSTTGLRVTWHTDEPGPSAWSAITVLIPHCASVDSVGSGWQGHDASVLSGALQDGDTITCRGHVFAFAGNTYGTSSMAAQALLSVEFDDPTLNQPDLAVEMIDFVPDPSAEEVARLHFRVIVTSDLEPVVGAEIFISDQPDISRGFTDISGALPASLTVSAPEETGTRTYTVTAVVEGCQIEIQFDFYTVSQSGAQEHTITQWEAFLYPFVSSAENVSIPVPGQIGNIISLATIFMLFSSAPTTGDVIGLVCYTYDVPDLSPTALLWGTQYRGETLIDESFNWYKEEDLTQEEINRLSELCSGTSRELLAQRVASPVFIHVRDPSGHYAGYDPLTQDALLEFPALFSDIGDEPFVFLTVQPVDGPYYVDMVGTGSGPYTVTFDALDSSGIGGNEIEINGSIELGEVRTYIVTYEGGAFEVREDAVSVNENGTPRMTMLDIQSPISAGNIRIQYSLAQMVNQVRIVMYDIAGRRVRTFDPAVCAPGVYILDWDRRDNNGMRVAAGVYVIQLVTGDVTLMKKVVLIR